MCNKLNCPTYPSSATPTKVTCLQWPLQGGKVSLQEKLRDIWVLMFGGDYVPVCNKLNCATHPSSATPTKVTCLQWPLQGGKVSLQEKLRDIWVLMFGGDYVPVCNKLNCPTYPSSTTPTKVTCLQWPLQGGKVSLQEKLRDIWVLMFGGDYMPVCNKLNCPIHPSSATPTKVTCLQWPLQGGKVSLQEKVRDIWVLMFGGNYVPVCNKLNFRQ